MKLAAVALCVALVTPSLAQAGWSKSYVVELYGDAFYYGSDSVDVEKPGTDCPRGTNPLPDWYAAAKRAGMPEEEAEKRRNPEYRNSAPTLSINHLIAQRGPNLSIIYENPESIPDPGLVTVQGKIAYGFDLDSDPATGGFTSPDGKVTGIDNAYYKVSGCIYRFRGALHKSQSAAYSNDGMHDGVYSVLLVLAGQGDDPRNDASATLGVYLSKDKMVKDANGAIARDFSFKVDPDPSFQTVLKVKVADGVIQTTEPQRIAMRDYQTPGFFPKQLVLEKGQVRLEMTPSGLKGLFGGYRDYMVYYKGTSGNGSHTSGAIHENLGRFEIPAWYRAMKREADGMPDPVTGEMRGISSAYAIEAIPAYVISPKGDRHVVVAETIR